MSTNVTRDAKAQAKADKAYAKATRPWYKKKRFWVLGLVLLLVLVAAMNMNSGGDNAGTTTGGSSSSQQQAPAEPEMTVTADQMMKDLEANALQAAETYKGKTITVTGKVGTIDSSGTYFSVMPDDEFAITGVRVDITPEQQSTVSGFTAGQDVSVTGPVKDVGEVMGYSMDANTIE